MSIVTETPDVGFERNWRAWKARGRAHERVVRQRVVAVAVVAAAVTLAALITYGLLFS